MENSNDAAGRSCKDVAPDFFWQRMTEDSPAMLWCINQNGVPIYYNRRWMQFAGMPEKSDLAAAWYSKLHPDDREWVIKTTGLALKQRQTIRIEYRLERFDGKYRNMIDMGDPHFDSQGKFLGYIGSTVDITEQVENAKRLEKSHEDLNRSAREIGLLNEFNDNLQVCKTIEETKPILKFYGQRLFENASVSICLYSESRNTVDPFVSWGDSATLEKMFSPDQCWALRRGKIHVAQSCSGGSLCPNTKNCNIKFGYACIPMLAYGEVLGVLNVCFHSSDKLVDEQGMLRNQLAQITADQVALAIANLKLRETLHHQSTRDPLTQLYNRRYLMDNLDREFCRASRDGTSINAVMLDVDYFKRFNDTYGHEAGDLVLRELGTLLRTSVRDSDIACRYGGEEFIIVLMDYNFADCLARAESIRRRISEMLVEIGNTPLGKVTASIGMAAYPEDCDSIEKLLSYSDQALYAAKKAGRNRVVAHRFADEDGQPLVPCEPVAQPFPAVPTVDVTTPIQVN